MKAPWTIIKDLRHQVATLQHTVDDVLSGTVGAVRTEGNPYPTYSEQVYELSRKYAGVAKWGNAAARNVIDVRSAFIISEGVKAVPYDSTKDAKREFDWLAGFIEHNRLDDEVPQDWAKEGEIEGKILLRLIPDSKTKQINVRFVSWTQHGYTVKTAADDYGQYTGASYKINKSGAEVNLKPEEFVYLRFGGRAHAVNNTPPKLGSVLVDMEGLNKALVDWRKINVYFASPTPYFKAPDKAAADALYNTLKTMKWRIGQFLVGTAEFSLVGMPPEGVNSVKDEITARAQVISGTSGIPVHFLGYPELMSNRSTADSLFESVHASTSKERRIWIGGYEELFRKAIAMANETMQAGLDPDLIAADIPEASSAKLKELTEIWFPIRAAGEISRETFLGKIPDLDVQAETKRLDDQDAKAMEQAMLSLKARPHQDDDPEDDE